MAMWPTSSDKDGALRRYPPHWNIRRCVWATGLAGAGMLLAILNLWLILPRKSAGHDPAENAELFCLLWIVLFIVGVVSLVVQAFIRRVPATMWVLVSLVTTFSAMAAIVNIVAYFMMVFDAVYGRHG